MKRNALILSLILIFILVPIAYAAQENNQELVNAVTAAVAALGALIANFIINALKTIPYLGDKDKDTLQRATLEIVSVVVGLLTGYVLSLLAQAMNLIPDSMTQTIAIAVLTPVFNELKYRLEKLSPQK